MSFYNEQGEPTIQILDHGVVISNDPSSINFTGAGVTVSILGQDITVDIPGGGTGGISSVTGALVNNTDPLNPVVAIGTGTVNTLPLISTVDGSNNIVTLADSLVSSNGISTIVTQPSFYFQYAYTSPVYDFAPSDPGFTPNGQRYIDTTNWNFCGVGAIISSDGNGLYNCDQTPLNGLTTYVTQLNKYYTFNNNQWLLGGNGVLELKNDAGISSIFLTNQSLIDLSTANHPTIQAVKGSLAIDVNTNNLWIQNGDSNGYLPSNWLSMVKSSNYGGNTSGTTSSVYDLASSDPGVTPNGTRYIDTTDWTGCGGNSIVSSNGLGSYTCEQTPSFISNTVLVTNQNLMYQWNGSEWTNGIVSPAYGYNSDVQGTDGYGNFKVNHYNTSLPSLSLDGQNNGATAFVSFNIQKSYTDNTKNQNLAIDNLTATRTIQFPDADGNIPLSVNGVTANNLGEITIPVGTGDISGTGTTNEIAYFTGASTIASLSTGTYPSLTELSYVKGVTSAIQTQLNAKGVGDMVLASVQTVTGAKTFNDTKLLLRNVANTFNGSFVNTNTADRVYTLPDATTTLIGNNVGISGGSTLIGGTAAGDKVLFKATSNSTNTTALNQFRFYPNGSTSTPIVSFGENASGDIMTFFNIAVGSETVNNYTFRAGTAASGILYINSASDTRIRTANVDYLIMGSGAGNVSIRKPIVTLMAAGTGAQQSVMTITSAAHTALTASTEYIDNNFNNARTVQFATGAKTLQRSALFQAPTYSAVAASTFTDSATVAITGAPIGGTNATLTNSHALLISAGALTNTTNGYGLTVNAPTGATNNYAAQFLGGTTIFGAPVRLKGYTVATLPAGTQGDTAFVTDATVVPAKGVAPVAGGTSFGVVVYDGAAWVGI
jgi:hypothetical protein